jgi:hypothetical protein
MMTQQDKQQIMSRIIQLETENTKLIFGGHKCTHDDFFEPKRQELTLLRCLYYGYKSKCCKIKKGSHGTLFS